MKPERRLLLHQLSRRALELDPAERDSFVELACGTDAELRRELELMLAADEQQTGRLDAPANEAAASHDSLESGDRVGRFELLGRLGEGGMGEVFLARDPRLGRTLALKLLPPDLVHDRDRVRRFEREARAASALNHPYICVVYETGQTEDGHPFIAMEHVEGQTLRQRLSRGPLPLAEALTVVRQAAEALAAAHRAGIVHRDVKPENLMLRDDGYVKVLDFGLAKLLEAPSDDAIAILDPSRTAEGRIVGTVRYMSPEQAHGHALDARTDVWSLGAVFYELLAGRPPFVGSSGADLIAAILMTEPEPLSNRVDGLPPDVERTIARALEKTAAHRFASCEELALELQRLELALRLDASGVSRSADAGHPGSPTNLLPRTSALLGRERELEEIAELVRDEGARLVTLTGPGGVGKTRLAVEAARRLNAGFPDGTFAVDLSPLADSRLLAAHVAKALGVSEAPGTSLASELERHLAPKRLLLVLDSFEHFLAAATDVARLLSASPGLTVIATSRERLRLSDEREYALEPLAVPDSARLPSLDSLMASPAVALFVERARETKPAFALTPENSRAVAEICRRVDGLPLAIELAAARIRLLSPAAMLERLERRLEVLGGGGPDLPSRQRTMRGAVAWSYDLLEAGEQAVLRRLAVFAGGAMLPAAEALCGAGQMEVLDALASLLDKSLLRQREQGDGEPRFLMLEVTREFALEQLEACGEGQLARQAHAEYYLEIAETADLALQGAQQAGWLERLEAEHDNLRAALAWLSERDADACLRMVAGVRLLWIRHGHYAEGRRWLGVALERSSAGPTTARLKALGAAGHLAMLQGDLAAARTLLEERLRIGRETGDPRTIAWGSFALGDLACVQGDLHAARAHLEESLAGGREAGDDRLVGNALNGLGEVARAEGAWAEAQARYEQAVASFRKAGDQASESISLANLGAAACEAGDLEVADAAYGNAIEIAEALGERDVIADCVEGSGAVAARRGEWARAARLGGAAEALREEVGSELDPVDQQQHDAWVARLRATLDAATLEREWARGRAMTHAEAAREVTDAAMSRQGELRHRKV